VISVGKNNSFGHPNLMAIKRLEKNGVEIFRTDQDGDIKITSDGEKINFK
jgi:competence protein ComEC